MTDQKQEHQKDELDELIDDFEHWDISGKVESEDDIQLMARIFVETLYERNNVTPNIKERVKRLFHEWIGDAMTYQQVTVALRTRALSIKNAMNYHRYLYHKKKSKCDSCLIC